MDFQKYNIKEKKKKKRKERKKQTKQTNKQKTKPQELLKNSNINHKKTIYSVCFKNRVFFLKSNNRL